MSLYSNLLDRLTAIRDEREMHANTASRVGQALIDILNAFTGKFLSRIYDDSAEGKITFKKGFQTDNFEQGQSGADVDASGRAELSSLHVRETAQLSGDVVFGTIQFQEGVSGGAIRQIGNAIHAEVDKLVVRNKMNVKEVEIQEVKYVGGSIVLSPADGFTITGVEYSEDYNIFFVYFDIEDSETEISTRPKWQVGDFAFSERFNAQNTSGDNIIHRWWREVVGIGGQVTDESSPYYGKYCIWLGNNENQCEDVWDGTSESHLPMVGDKVVMLGNRNDASRQGAIILASAGGSGDPALPYIRVYRNIYTFDLSQATLVHQISYAGLITNTQNWNLNVDLGSSVKTVPFNTLYKEIDDIASQMDESFRVWHVDYDNTTPPSLSNLPASQWGGTGQDPYSEHVGDFCITSDGFCYEFKNLPETDENVYGWVIVTDQYLISYVEQIGEKKRVFPSKPSENAMYEVGDLWLNATYPNADDIAGHSGDPDWADRFVGDLYDKITLVCNSDKDERFNIEDWGPADTKQTWLHQWQTGAGDEGGASHNMFIGTEFGKKGVSTHGNHDVIYTPIQAAGFRIAPSSAAIQVFYRGTNNEPKKAELVFDIDEDESAAKLSADSIKLEGYTTINGNFKIDEDGNMEAVAGSFSGFITNKETILTALNISDHIKKEVCAYSGNTELTLSLNDVGQNLAFYSTPGSGGAQYSDYGGSTNYILPQGYDSIDDYLEEQYPEWTDIGMRLNLPFDIAYLDESHFSRMAVIVNYNVVGYGVDGLGLYRQYKNNAALDEISQEDESSAEWLDYPFKFEGERGKRAKELVGCTINMRLYGTEEGIGMLFRGIVSAKVGNDVFYYRTSSATINVDGVHTLALDPYKAGGYDAYRAALGLNNEYNHIILEGIQYVDDSSAYVTGWQISFAKIGYYDRYSIGLEDNDSPTPPLPPIVQPTLDDIENRYINTQGVWYARYYSVIVDVSRARGQYISANAGSQYAFLTSYNDTNVTFVSGGSRVGARPNHVLIPNDAVYIYLYVGTTMPTVAPVFTLSEE